MHRDGNCRQLRNYFELNQSSLYIRNFIQKTLWNAGTLFFEQQVKKWINHFFCVIDSCQYRTPPLTEPVRNASS